MRKHPRKSEKLEPEEHPVEPEMEKGPEKDELERRTPASEPSKEKRKDDL